MDSWMFFDVSKADEQSKVGVVQMFAQIIRAIVYTNDVICPPATQDIDFTKTVAFGFDKSMPYRNKYMGGSQYYWRAVCSSRRRRSIQ